MGKYFGTDGVRGVANEELTVLMALKIGQYLGYTYQGENILIGSDTRKSKDMFEAALCAGITSAGANASVLGVVTTPCVSYLTRTKGFKAGIMISASHNPYYDNGIKIFNEQGEKISAELELNIEEYMDNKSEIVLATNENIGLIYDYSTAVDEYIDYLTSSIESDLSSFKVLVDCANGSASAIASKLLNKLNIEYTLLACDPNGVNINVNCGSTHLDNLKENIDSSYDLGIAFDGDADRMLAIRNNKDIIDGDKIMYICAKALAKKDMLNNKTLVTTIMSNIGLYKALDKENIKYEKTAVGDKYVYENMLANSHSLGGEQSGHIIFKEYASTGDGLLTMLQFLQALVFLEKDGYSKLFDEVVIYPQLLKNIRVEDKDVVLNSKILADEVAKVEDELSNEGRVLIRASGTEPLIRVMVEASSDEICQKQVNHLIKIIEEI